MASRSSNNAKTRVGKYELGRTLGEGSFAKVKFAKNVETGENVAIKILDKEKVLKHKMIGQVNTHESNLFEFALQICVCIYIYIMYILIAFVWRF